MSTKKDTVIWCTEDGRLYVAETPRSKLDEPIEKIKYLPEQCHD